MSTSGHGLLGPAGSIPYVPWYRPCRSLFSSTSPSETCVCMCIVEVSKVRVLKRASEEGEGGERLLVP